MIRQIIIFIYSEIKRYPSWMSKAYRKAYEKQKCRCYNCVNRIFGKVIKPRERIFEFEYIYCSLKAGEPAPNLGIYYFEEDEEGHRENFILQKGQSLNKDCYFTFNDKSFEISLEFPNFDMELTCLTDGINKTSSCYVYQCQFAEEGIIKVEPKQYNTSLFYLITLFPLLSFLKKKNEDYLKNFKDIEKKYDNGLDCIYNYNLRLNDRLINKEKYEYYINYYSVVQKVFNDLFDNSINFFKLMDFCHVITSIESCEYLYDLLEGNFYTSNNLKTVKNFLETISLLEEKLEKFKIKTPDEKYRNIIYRGCLNRTKNILNVRFVKLSMDEMISSYSIKHNYFHSGATSIQAFFENFGPELKLLKVFWSEDVIINKFYNFMLPHEKTNFIKNYGSLPSIEDFKKLVPKEK